MKKVLFLLVLVIAIASCKEKAEADMKPAGLYLVDVTMPDGARLEYYLYAINEDYAVDAVIRKTGSTGIGYSASLVKLENTPFQYQIVTK